MARALVTGAAGFVGSHLVDRLLDEGWEVIGVDNFITGTPRNLSHLDGVVGFRFIEADVTHPVDLDGVVERIYHLASPASPIDYLELPFETLYAGSHATQHLLELAERDGARFLLASTSEVYGDPAIHPQPESYWGNVNPIGPRSVYDEAKRYAEAITMAFHRYRQVDIRIARLFNTYGPRMRHDDGRVVPTFCCQALQGEPLTVFGDGHQTRSFCFVSDTVDGLFRLMEGDEPGPVNLGNPYELSMHELAGAICAAAGARPEVRHRPLPQDDPKLRRPDIALARRALGWSPQVLFDDGIRHTLAYFAEVLAEQG